MMIGLDTDENYKRINHNESLSISKSTQETLEFYSNQAQDGHLQVSCNM